MRLLQPLILGSLILIAIALACLYIFFISHETPEQQFAEQIRHKVYYDPPVLVGLGNIKELAKWAISQHVDLYEMYEHYTADPRIRNTLAYCLIAIDDKRYLLHINEPSEIIPNDEVHLWVLLVNPLSPELSELPYSTLQEPYSCMRCLYTQIQRDCSALRGMLTRGTDLRGLNHNT